MAGTYILAVIGATWLMCQLIKIGLLFVDKFIWHYSERSERLMIHELLEDATGSNVKEVLVMGDLISRESVIDVLKQTGIIQDNDRGHLVVDEINRIPTAYNVEKVVAELEKESKTMLPVIPTSEAIDIVRKGGV